MKLFKPKLQTHALHGHPEACAQAQPQVHMTVHCYQFIIGEILFLVYLFMNTNALPEYMYVHHVPNTHRSQKKASGPGTGIMGVCEPLCMC